MRLCMLVREGASPLAVAGFHWVPLGWVLVGVGGWVARIRQNRVCGECPFPLYSYPTVSVHVHFHFSDKFGWFGVINAFKMQQHVNYVPFLRPQKSDLRKIFNWGCPRQTDIFYSTPSHMFVALCSILYSTLISIKY